MPHGGGHHGGGGFHHHGGGGFGHWGGHRHHHHHRHYGYRPTGVWWYGGGGYYGYRRGRIIFWGSSLVVTCIIIIAVTLSVRFSTGGEDEKYFTPGDTRIHSFSSFFCSGLQVGVPGLPSGSTGHAYLIDTVPPLSEKNMVNFTKYFGLNSGEFEYWHYYLYKGSNISYSACVSEDSHATSFSFYIVKGTSKFSSWKDEPTKSKAVSSVYVATSCDQGFNYLTYSIKDEDHYYLAYSHTASYNLRGMQNIIIERFEYSAPNTSLSSCELSNDNTCTLSVGFSAKKNKGLVILPIPSNIDWDSTLYKVMFKCSPQAFGYVIITLVPLAFVFIVLFVIIIFCVYRAKKSSSKPVGVQGASDETEKTPLHTDQPPPYNPNY
uniref:E3 ubiquitin-protein ligase APD1-4 middle domain-containing protein n=1 Tax=Amphimedon queenslandica TaxID=400682 RepID=A0A1X7VTW5_AMPQE